MDNIDNIKFIKNFLKDDSGDVGASLTWIEAVLTLGFMGFIFLIFGELETELYNITASQIAIPAATREFFHIVFRIGFPILVLITTGLFVMARRSKRSDVIV